MKFVLVDTSVWSLALRKHELTRDEKKLRDYLAYLIRNALVIMIGPIRQEILSGISDYDTFLSLKNALHAFADLEISTEDFENAAKFYNLCRKHGIQGSHTDFFICSVAKNHNFSILTLDKDFSNYDKYIDLDIIDKSA